MILDEDGELVWFRPLDTEGVTDFRAQRYDGRPVLTWWRGQSEQGIGDGHFVIVDDAYREIATVSAGNGLAGDIHEFLITERDTALILVYDRIPRDLSAVGGPADGAIWDGIVQELEIPSGRVLFEWHSAEHVELEESYADVPQAERGAEADAYDYFHPNSVELDDDGNFIVSARNTHAVYKLARSDGEVLWRLGGKRSDYALGSGVRFAWQHDARRQPDGTLTLYDNVADEEDAGGASRALVLRPRRRADASDGRPQPRASDRAAGDDAGERPVPPGRACLRGLGRAAATSPSSTGTGASCSTDASASTARTRTAPTASRGRAARSSDPRSPSRPAVTEAGSHERAGTGRPRLRAGRC